MRLIVEVITPGNGKTYEILLDDTLTVGTAKEKIIEQIISFENENIAFDDNVALFSSTARSPLPDFKNLRAAGVKGGQSLLLL